MAVFLQTSLFAQMQGAIISSTEREVPSIEPVVNTIKVKKYSDEKIITLCKDSITGNFCFLKTETGSSIVNYGILPSKFEVYDFKILGKNIYFCGYDGRFGFIGKISFNTLFTGGNFDYYEIPQTSVVYELEVYYNAITDSDDIVALGTNSTSTTYYCINYNTNTSTSYDIYYIQGHVLQSITQTNNYIGVVISDPTTNEFGVIRHQKNNISNLQGQTWQFAYSAYKWIDQRPENRTYAYLSEAIDDTDEILVATSLDYLNSHPDFGVVGNFRTVNVYRVDLSTLQLLSTQVIPTDGKPYFKDMVYIQDNGSLNILTNVQVGSDAWNNFPYCCLLDIDIIYHIDATATNQYQLSFTIPNVSNESYHLLNGIETYEDYYYIVAGKTKTNKFVLFDKYIPSTITNCYRFYYTKAFFDPSLPMNTISYPNYSTPKTVYIDNNSISSNKYNIICP